LTLGKELPEMNNNIKFKNIAFSFILGYGIYFSGIVSNAIGHQILINPNWLYELVSSKSDAVSIVFIFLMLVVSMFNELLFLPICLTFLLIFFTILVIPFSDGTISLHHEPTFDIYVFLCNGNYGMIGLITLTIYSWVLYLKNLPNKRVHRTS
jgi:hypothetical protein